MNPKRYKEFKVVIEKDGKGGFKIVEKFPTKRGHVSIHEHEAEINNKQVSRSKLWYELDENQPADAEKAALMKEADELGIKYPKSIGVEKLREKIANLKSE